MFTSQDLIHFDPEMEESNVEIRMQELEKVFKQMKEMLAANPWVELDIFKKGREVRESTLNNIK